MMNKTNSIFLNNVQSWREVSKDTSSETDVFMVDSPKTTVNFDLVKREYVNSFGCSEDDACSVDALGATKDSLIFVEFKNGEVHRDVQDKIRDSLLMFCDIVRVSVDFTRHHMEMVLVYNGEINKTKIQQSASRDELKQLLLRKGGEELIYFGLGRFKKLYFRDVHTYTVEQFKPLLDLMTEITNDSGLIGELIPEAVRNKG